MTMPTLVSANGPANVGDLFVNLSPVAGLAIGYRQRLLFAGPASPVMNALWLVYYTQGPSDAD